MRFKKVKFWSLDDWKWHHSKEFFVLLIWVVSEIWCLKLDIKLWCKRTKGKILSKFD